jgi:starch synthase
MQAMAYGTIPIVTRVGGLVDTVHDADESKAGTGFAAKSTDTAGVIDAIHRAIRAWKQPRRRAAIQRRGMQADWSWTNPAQRHVELYEDLVASGPVSRS